MLVGSFIYSNKCGTAFTTTVSRAIYRISGRREEESIICKTNKHNKTQQ